MKNLKQVYKKLGALGVLFFLIMSAMPGKSVAPIYHFKQVMIPNDYFTIINHTYWFSYLVKENKTRRIGITIEPPFYLKNIIVKKTIKPNLFGEIELQSTITYKSFDAITMSAWINIFTNNDSVFFLKAQNKTDENIPFFYQISYEDEKSNIWRTKEIFPILYLSNNLDSFYNPIKIEKATNFHTKGEPYFFRTLRFDEKIHQGLKGPIFVYKNLSGGLQERIDSISSSEIRTNQGRIILENNVFFQKHLVLEDWVFFSSNHLLSIESSVTKKIIQTLDFNKLKRFSRDGFFYKCVNDGYLGENDNTYYWDYSMYGARSILEYFYTEDQTLFYDFAILSYLSLCRNRNASGYWSNQTISSWLLTDYQIKNSYFDTRFNVDAGIFLLEIYQHFKIPYALTMSEKIGNILLVMMQNKKAYFTDNGGLLLQDYDISYQSKVKTHTSLNHLLNESSFFLLLYKTTKKEKYLFAQHQLILGIMATEDQWKDKKTGDLFYCMHPDYSFGRKDYVTLTYHDLLRFNRLLGTITGLENQSINRLGSFKENYLIKQGVVKNKKFNLDKEME